MKKTLLSAAIALTGLAAFSSANAQTNGDAFLGFEATSGTGSSTNLVVDIGPATNLAALNLNLAADLTAVYGAGWASDTSLYYGIIGGAYANAAANGDSKNTFYASVYSGGNPWLRASVSLQSGTTGDISAMANTYTVDVNNTQDGLTSQIGVAAGAVYMGTSEDQSWSFNSSYSGTSFNLTATIEAPITNSIDVYRVVPASGTNINTASTLTTTLDLGSDGTIAAVPEPATYALFGLGALVLTVVARRRNA